MNDKLNIMVVTNNDRAINLVNVLQDKKDFVRYFISHQVTRELSPHTKSVLEKIKKRHDVTYSQIDSIGVAKNRNNALNMVDEGIGLCADDDIKYLPNAFEKIIHSFQALPKADFISFKIQTPEGKDFKKYPSKTKKLHLYSILFTGTVEMAFKIKKIKENNIKFDEDFGPGANSFPLGEDAIFIADAVKKGLKIYFQPVTILSHPVISSGTKLDEKTIFARGAVFQRIYGDYSPVISFLFSLKKYLGYKKEISFKNYLNLLLKGAKTYKEFTKI